MKRSLVTLFVLVVAYRAQERYPARAEGVHVLDPFLMSAPHSWSNHGNEPQIDDENIHPTTCLICCKNKSPKFSTSLCLNNKICYTKRCLKYLSKPRASHRRVSANAHGRQARTEEQLIPQEHSQYYCRSMYPLYVDISLAPVPGEPCSFTCVSQNSPVLPNYKVPNGWACNGDTQRICWDGKCMDRAEQEENVLCKERFPTKPNVTALVKLDCQIACQTSAEGEVSYLLRYDNGNCDPPDWLPFHMEV